MLVTRMLRDSRIAARDAAAMPFPNEETTPPVTKTYFAIYPSRGEMTKFTGFFFLSLRKRRIAAAAQPEAEIFSKNKPVPAFAGATSSAPQSTYTHCVSTQLS